MGEGNTEVQEGQGRVRRQQGEQGNESKNNASGTDRGRLPCKSVGGKKTGDRCEEQDNVIKQVS